MSRLDTANRPKTRGRACGDRPHRAKSADLGALVGKTISPKPCGASLASKLFGADENVQSDNFHRLNLVIDLDATFVSTHVTMENYGEMEKIMEGLEAAGRTAEWEDLKRRIFVFTVGGTNMWTILRPGSFEFIDFATSYFKNIIVWSAGQREYVNAIVGLLFAPPFQRPALVLCWDDCVTEDAPKDEDESGGAASPSNTTYIKFSKPLRNFFAEAGEGDTIMNTFILDDRRDIAKNNESNLLQIPPYEPAVTSRELLAEDPTFARLIMWLMRPEVYGCRDVQKLRKDRVFSKSAAR